MTETADTNAPAQDSPASYPVASLRRRFAAILYDFFLIFAIWAITGSLLLALFDAGAPADGRLPDDQPLDPIWVQLIMYTETFLFYFYFWRIKGQTLGMQVWKIRCVDENDQLLGFAKSVKRFICATVSLAPFGLGMFWALFNRRRLSLHDAMSNTRVIYLGKKPYPSEQKTAP